MKNVSTVAVAERMTFSIEEEFTLVNGYAWIGYEKCPVCQTEVLSIVDNDPGSTEAAVGVRHVCDHPTCREAAGASIIICGTDIDSILSKTLYGLIELDDVVECDHGMVDIASIIDRRSEVLRALEMIESDYDDGDVDLSTEKWNNYWGDYSQCGVRVSY